MPRGHTPGQYLDQPLVVGPDATLSPPQDLRFLGLEPSVVRQPDFTHTLPGMKLALRLHQLWACFWVLLSKVNRGMSHRDRAPRGRCGVRQDGLLSKSSWKQA
ncbi:hypothetical protein B0J18DRAFT_439420 [Chaetomium sp. MPI-SDFR-AT-0129]|nr:hypothetical protein B0J18DRAFT_439420 [Chaetomium sp. MPI-SDFR-AT-0129]